MRISVRDKFGGHSRSVLPRTVFTRHETRHASACNAPRESRQSGRAASTCRFQADFSFPSRTRELLRVDIKCQLMDVSSTR